MERRYELIVLLIAPAIFLTGILGPPSLMDDVDPRRRRWRTTWSSRATGSRCASMTAVCHLIFGVDLPRRWAQPERCYLAAEDPQTPRLENLVGRSNLHAVAESGGKTFFTNQTVHPVRSPHAHRN